MSSQTPPTQALQRYFGWAEAAAYSGLSDDTLRRMAAAGRLRLYRPTGRRVLLDRVELDAAIRGEAPDAVQSRSEMNRT